MKILRHAKQELDINLTPLIDIVFLLLIFFMVSTTFTKETRLMLNLPEAEGEPGGQVDTIEITISATSEYGVNGKALVNQKIQTLMSAIVKESDKKTDAPVALSADKNAPHQAVVKALDALGRLGFSNIQITTKGPVDGDK